MFLLFYINLSLPKEWLPWRKRMKLWTPFKPTERHHDFWEAMMSPKTFYDLEKEIVSVELAFDEHCLSQCHVF